MIPYYFGFIVLLLSDPLLSEEVQASNEQVQEACHSIEFYSREGCPHCAAATDFLEKLKTSKGDLSVNKVDINQSKDALSKFISENERFGIKRAGVPLIVICDRYYIGFDTEETSGNEILALLSQSVNKATRETEATILQTSRETGERIGLPVFGEVALKDLGLPLFTIVIGLIDGFNPCAMWVLLFILSLVVNIKDRKKVVLIAGTFVLISGIVYFAFMAAWLNLFKVIGWSRNLQLILAVLALVIAIIHIKDFFAFKQGVSLSIPDRYKPAIYRQSRQVIKNNSLILSMSAVAMLAVMVNFIELLCTAGLPALYTQILVQQDVSGSTYYAYLGLYNLAYIFDDGLMVAIAVVTLRHNKLQEQQGKWLKLLSGITILVLALLLLFEPAWLF